MTVDELIDQLIRIPGHYNVLACDGWGLSGDARIEDWVDEDAERIWITS